MTKASDNVYPRFLVSEGGSTATPAAGQVTVYAKADGLLYQKDDAGVETLLAGGAGGAPSTADYLVGTANGSLSAEIVVGTSPGGELGGTWASPTVDATHSGSAHAGYEFDYVQITSDVALSGTTEGTADTVITGTSQAYAAVPTLIEFSCVEAQTHPSAGANIVVLLYDGASVLGRMGVVINPAAATFRLPLRLAYRLTPTAATHQYIIKATISGSGGAPYIGAGAGGTGTSLPAFLRITKA